MKDEGVKAARRAGVISWLVLGVALVLVGCDRGPEPAVRVGTNLWPGYEPLYLARDLGYFTDEEVRLVELASASEVIRHFSNGNLDAAALTLDEVLLLAQAGLDPRIICVMDVSHGGDVILGQASIASMDQLVGKRVAVETTALGSYVLARALELSGLQASDIKVVPTAYSDHESVFRSGKVDAVVTFEPVRTRLLAAGATPLFDSRAIPGEVVDVLVVSPDFLERNPQALRALLDSWFRALEYLDEQAEDAYVRIGRRLALDAREVAAGYEGLRLPGRSENRELLTGGDHTEPSLLRVADALADSMRDNRLIDGPADTKALFRDVPQLLHE